MDKLQRKALIEQYKQMKVYFGVFAVRNLQNGKIYIGTCNNLKSRWLTLKGQLDAGRFANAALQKAWNEEGENAFVYEVLEQKEKKEETDVNWELKQMGAAWMEKLAPYGDKGYHRPPQQ